MKLKINVVLTFLMVCGAFLLGGCNRNNINPDGEGCRKIEEISGPEYPSVMWPSANWGTGKFVVSVQPGEDDPWQLRAYEADMTAFTVLDEAPIVHVSAWSKRNWIAYYDWDDGGVYRIKPDGSFKQRLTASPMTPTLNWHPEEDILLIGNAFELWRVDLNGNLIGDTLRYSDPDLPLARMFVPMFWLEPDRIYGTRQERSKMSYYKISDKEVVEIYSFSDELDPSKWVNDISSIGNNKFVFSGGQGVFLFDLTDKKVGKRLLKDCENQSASRLSAYDTENFFMEVFLVGKDGIHRTRVFRKNINKNSEEELEIF